MAKSATLDIVIAATADKALEAFDKVKEKSTGSYTALKVGAVAAASAVIAGLGEATSAAAEHEVSVSKLEQAYKNAGVSTDDMNKSLEDIEASSRRTGQSTEDNIAAYTKLVTATKDTSKAHQELAVAQDLAAYKGITVSDATDAVIKASEGNTKALKAMGIATTDAAGNQLSAAQVMANLTQAVHGQADAFGNTASGQMARYKESLDQTKVAVGEALLPALKSLLDMLQPLFAWLANNQSVIKTLTPIVAILAGTVLAVVAALKVWTAVQTVLNVVLSANPIGLIILGIAALIAAIVVVVTHWRDFAGAVQTVWGWLQNLGNWVLSNWKIIVDVLLGPMGLLVTNLGTVKKVIEDIIGALERVGHAVSDALGWLGKLSSAGGGILSKINPFSALSAEAGPAAATPVIIQVTATPGSDLPEVVYSALREYQRRHVRPELRPMFAPMGR